MRVFVLLLAYPVVPALGIWAGLTTDALFHLRLWSSICLAIGGLLILVPGHSFSGVWSSSLANRLTMIAIMAAAHVEFLLVERIVNWGVKIVG